MTELCEELFGYAEDAKKTGTPVPMDDVIELLLPTPEEAVAALHEFLDDEEERLDLPARQSLVQDILRASESIPGLLPLLQDPVLQELIE